MIERRQHPRVVTEFPVRVCNRLGAVMKTQLLDLSLSGLGLAANDALVAHLQGDIQDTTRVMPEEFRVEFTLPLNDQELAIGLYCRLVYRRRLSQHAYQMGVRILKYDAESENRLERYVHSRLM